MGEIDERRISGVPIFEKFILPPIWLGFALFWTIGVTFFSGVQQKGPSPAAGCIGLVMFGGGLFYFIRYHFPLKIVWISEHGLRVSNFRVEVIVPFETIEEVIQPVNNPVCVVVILDVATPFGHRFTFVPRYPKFRWTFSRGVDEVVVELRSRVEAARKVKGAKLSSNSHTRAGRSPMADAELDGPL